MAESILKYSIDDYLSITPAGSMDRAIYNNLQAINFLRAPSNLPYTKDRPPLVFFTRPMLNMQKDNIRNVRQLSALLSSVPASMQTYIRAMLDPRLCRGVDYATFTIPPEYCPLIDNFQAFIPFMTNNITSMSAPPSLTVPTFTSAPGLYNESFAMVDGRVLISEIWDTNLTVKNVHGDPTLLLMYVWCLYMSSVFEGRVSPYIDFIAENELDYCTRIYWLVLRPDGRTISKFAATHASFPTGVSIGESFALSGDQVYSDANRDVSLTFKSAGIDYFDPITVKEFNETVALFNEEMQDGWRDTYMVKIPWSMAGAFNNLPGVYPRIEPTTKTLDWYAKVSVFNAVAAKMLRISPDADISELTDESALEIED